MKKAYMTNKEDLQLIGYRKPECTPTYEIRIGDQSFDLTEKDLLFLQDASTQLLVDYT